MKSTVVSEPVQLRPQPEPPVEPVYTSTPKLDKEAWKFSVEKPAVEEIGFHAGTELAENTAGFKEKKSILPERKEIINPFYIQAKVIGQVLNTYIVLEYNSSVFLLDQHAAHERLMYERLMEAYRKNMRLPSQTLLCPITVSLSPSEMSSYETIANKLSELGFQIEIFGRDAIIIRSVPAVMSGQDVVAAVEALLAKGER